VSNFDIIKNNSTLERALSIMSSLSYSDGKLSLAQLAEGVSLPRSTTHRILEILTKANFIEYDPITQKYSIGLKAIEIGIAGLNNVDLVEAALPHLRELSAISGQTSFLAVHNNGEIVYINKVEGTSSVIMNGNLGRRCPMHCTGLGKAMLASFSLGEIDKVVALKGLNKYTDYTITEYDRLLEELSHIRVTGVAFNHEEYDIALSSIAAPIFNYSGQAVAAISVAGPTERIVENAESFKPLVREKGELISKRLGFVKKMRTATL
jgi:IclR family KDG regulon transcriptional repressor